MHTPARHLVSGGGALTRSKSLPTKIKGLPALALLESAVRESQPRFGLDTRIEAEIRPPTAEMLRSVNLPQSNELPHESSVAASSQPTLDDRSGDLSVSQSSLQGRTVQCQRSDPMAAASSQPGLLDERDDFASTRSHQLEICDISGSDHGGGSSHGGDTVASETEDDIANGNLTAVAERHSKRPQPKQTSAGYKRQHNKTPSNHNKKTQVGNIGIMLGNWGERAARDEQTRHVQDKQVRGNPAHIVVVLEANEACKHLLQQKPKYVEEYDISEPEEDSNIANVRWPNWQTEKAKLDNVASKHWHEHHAIITKFPKGKQILMAARKDDCRGMTCLYHEHWEDGLFRIKGKKKNRYATSTVMICKFDWKQNIGHIGLEVRVMAVQMHKHTANMKYSEQRINKWWDAISELIKKYTPRFLLGDFNMSLTQVIPRLRARGHLVDTCSWYPWMKMDADESCDGYRLGVDSMGMFHIGGDVDCALTWDFESIGMILKAAAWNADDDIETLLRQGPQSRH